MGTVKKPSLALMYISESPFAVTTLPDMVPPPYRFADWYSHRLNRRFQKTKNGNIFAQMRPWLYCRTLSTNRQSLAMPRACIYGHVKNLALPRTGSSVSRQGV